MTGLTRQPHFVLFPFMEQGHMIPTIDIARLLAQRGTIVTILTTPSNAKRFNSVIARAIQKRQKIHVIHLNFPSIEAGLPQGCENIDMLPSIDMMKNFFNATQMLQTQVEEVLQELEPSPSCIISDMCFPWTTKVAKKINIPRFVFHGICSFSLLCLHNLRELKVLESVDTDDEYFLVPGLPNKVELTKAQLKTLVDPSDLYWKRFGELRKEAEDEAYGVVVNSFEELEPEYVEGLKKATGKTVWTIGPVSLCNNEKKDKVERGEKASIDEQHCLKWLDSLESNSVLFVCLGSLSRLPTSQMKELALGLELSKRPFIWVVKHISDEFGKWLNEENFEERVQKQGILIHGWAPQVLILSHPSVGGFLTHCGWNSSIEAISSGLPMITWPLFAEQFCNDRLIVDVLDAGVKAGMENRVMFLDEEKVDTHVKKDEIKMIIERVMGEEEEAKMRRERAKKLGEMARRAVEEGGSSHMNLTKLIQDVTEQANLEKIYVKSN
ncbi:UDP-glycosyltransferase 73C4-like [Lycium ferocissimum]|uniref:UDP-glycosyltransferase 73C4-like n=1 Tax=Lycium ferocissimum TaxID=112874 RepID=UPI00281669E3|nr:UDP-glycosyltransferase 73C4-like [Lycium ferocissimum]